MYRVSLSLSSAWERLVLDGEGKKHRSSHTQLPSFPFLSFLQIPRPRRTSFPALVCSSGLLTGPSSVEPREWVVRREEKGQMVSSMLSSKVSSRPSLRSPSLADLSLSHPPLPSSTPLRHLHSFSRSAVSRFSTLRLLLSLRRISPVRSSFRSEVLFSRSSPRKKSSEVQQGKTKRSPFNLDQDGHASRDGRATLSFLPSLFKLFAQYRDFTCRQITKISRRRLRKERQF